MYFPQIQTEVYRFHTFHILCTELHAACKHIKFCWRCKHYNFCIILRVNVCYCMTYHLGPIHTDKAQYVKHKNQVNPVNMQNLYPYLLNLSQMSGETSGSLELGRQISVCSRSWQDTPYCLNTWSGHTAHQPENTKQQLSRCQQYWDRKVWYEYISDQQSYRPAWIKIKKVSLTCSTFLPLPCGQKLCSQHFQNHSLIKFLRGATVPNLDWYHLCTITTDMMEPYQMQHIALSWRATKLFNSWIQCQSVAERRTTVLLGNFKAPYNT